MNMKIDASRIRAERLRRAWTQDQLAQVSGLGLRTVHRIEKHGQCSLESLRSMAAVFELSPEALMMENPSPHSHSATQEKPAASKAIGMFSAGLHKFLTGGVAGALFASASFMLADAVAASQVSLDLRGSIDGEHVESLLLTDDGAEAVIQLDGLMRIVLVPTVKEDEVIMLNAEIYAWENDAFTLVAQPGMLARNREEASLRLSLPSGKTVVFAITPEIR